MMIALLLLIIAAGLGVMGRPLGILIDPRNRMSLTRAQLAVWTVILLGGWATFGLFNVGFAATDIRDLGQMAFHEGQAALGDSNVNTSAGGPLTDLAQRLFAFPSMDWALWALLGITIGTSALSALMLRPSGPPVNLKDGPQEKPTIVLENPRPDDATLADLVYGETSESENVVDANRVQYVGITAVLAGSYAHELFQSGLAIDGLRAVRAVELTAPIFAAMPPISPSFLSLLVVSHGALLLGKYYQNSRVA
jgi:hypothetical protein